MIYLQNTLEAQEVFIPKNGIEAQGDLVFVAKSTIDLEVKIDQWVIDLGTSEQYYNIAIELPEGIPAGEYEYKLYGGFRELSTGLLFLENDARQCGYNKCITYEQYEQYGTE